MKKTPGKKDEPKKQADKPTQQPTAPTPVAAPKTNLTTPAPTAPVQGTTVAPAQANV